MLRKIVKVRLDPTTEQENWLAQVFGCSRWWWNYALNKSIETYKETGKGLGRTALNALLPALKGAEETKWLGDCYSQVLQATTLNLTTAYKNFFEGRARFPRFKSKKGKQSAQYPQHVKILDDIVKFPGNVGEVKASIHRPIEGKIKTVTVSKCPSGKYFASIMFEVDGDTPIPSTGEKIIGIDLGLKDFATIHDGEKTEKYSNPKHLKRHEKNLARKQKKHARKQKGSKSREKSRKLVAKVHERVANTRQDFLHKLSKKLVDESQVIVVENLNVGGMKRNHKLSKSISDVGWGIFVNFLDYKLQNRQGRLIEISRFFPSSKICSSCNHILDKLPLDIREWDCPKCFVHHDRDDNAAKNIRTEGIRIMNSPASQEVGGGNPVTAGGDCVRPNTRFGVGAAVVETRSPDFLSRGSSLTTNYEVVLASAIALG